MTQVSFEGSDNTEIWKQIFIDGVETKYEVSNIGNVRNSRTGNFIKGNISRDGYVKLNLYCGDNRYTKLVHRLVAEVFIPNPNNLPQVDHKDGNKTNNHVSNLRWVTASENIKAAFKMGLKTQYGESNPANKYSEETIIRTCELLQSGNYTCKEVADITGVDSEMVGHISRKERWKNITEKYDFSNIKRKNADHSKITASVDIAIKSGKSRKDIVETLIAHGLTKNQSTNLYKRRKESVMSGKSLVEYTGDIDDVN